MRWRLKVNVLIYWQYHFLKQMTIMSLVLVRLPPVALKIFNPHQFLSMAAKAQRDYPENSSGKETETLENYPIPLSPPPPLISKNVELSRALTASYKSSLFSLTRKDVLFEDEWLIAVNKPQGIYCESVLSSVATLLNVDQGDKANMKKLHLCNRLDRDTSGVTVITKTQRVVAKLVKAFTEHKVKKTYIAVCVGTSPKLKNVIIKSGHGRSKHGAWRVYALSDAGRTLPGGSLVRDMQTSFEILTVNGQKAVQELAGSTEVGEHVIAVEEKAGIASDMEKVEVLLKAYPRSGRTHQIRLHCQYLGFPIRGDVKYDGVYEWNDKRHEWHELHAESLSFDHPVTDQSISIQAPLPLWANQALGQVSSEFVGPLHQQTAP